MKLFDESLSDRFMKGISNDQKMALEGKMLYKDECRAADWDDANEITQEYSSFAWAARYEIDEYALIYDNGKKAVMRYEEHQDQLSDKYKGRALRPQEAYALLMGYYESRLPSKKMNIIVKDMLQGQPEYLSHAMQMSKGNLYIYEDVKGISWHETHNGYGKGMLRECYKRKLEFDIPKIRVGWNSVADINNQNPMLVSYLFGRHYSNMPKVMRKYMGGFNMHIPKNDSVWPLCLGIKGRFNLGSAFKDCASRGVEEIIPF